MHKIALIIQREFLTRVRKKSFLIMTLIGPLLMAALLILPIYISNFTDDHKTIAIVDESGLFYKKFSNTDNISFIYLNENIVQAKDQFFKKDIYGILYIPDIIINSPQTARIYSDKQVSLNIKLFLEGSIKQELESLKMKASGLDEKTLNSIKADVVINTISLEETGEEERTFSEVTTIVGLFSGIFIYFFIFMFGAQVMRGVIEEKTSRIIEVMISSVKPFQLMMGKIVGVALVGLTQFILWIVLTFSIYGVVSKAYPEVFNPANKTNISTLNKSKLLAKDELTVMAQNEKAIVYEDKTAILEAITSIDYGVMIFSFVFFFLGGYLLYGALFAAVGAAVDNETDTQQFMLPITIPMLFSIIMAQFIINNPDGPIAYWLSIIPFTSPIIMMIRIPFGVPYHELFLSMSLLIIGFVASTWLAAKIYRTGILMYGKKASYKEIWKWIKHS